MNIRETYSGNGQYTAIAEDVLLELLKQAQQANVLLVAILEKLTRMNDRGGTI